MNVTIKKKIETQNFLNKHMITEFCTPAELRLCCLKAYGMELTEGDSAPKIKK